MDTHSGTHTLTILTATGGAIPTATSPADAAGYQALITALAQAGPVAGVGVEGTNSYWAGLARAPAAAGHTVKEVLRPSRRVRRLHGKSDPVDKVATARSLLSGNGVSGAKDTTTPAESIRLLLAARTQLIHVATVMSNTISQNLVTAPEQVRARYRGQAATPLARRLATARPTRDDTRPPTADGRPYKPTTQGKIERFWQTLHKHLAVRPATTLTGLQTILDAFRDYYNNERPHRALGRRTPAFAYRLIPKATPTPPQDPHLWRVRYDTIDHDGKISLRHSGRLLHPGIGRAHAHTDIACLIHNNNATVIHLGTAEILGEYTLDPSHGYQRKNG